MDRKLILQSIFLKKILCLDPWKCFFLVLDVDLSLLEEFLPVLDFLESSMRVLLSTLMLHTRFPNLLDFFLDPKLVI